MNLPRGDKSEMSRFARVNKTIGRFSSRRSSASYGRKPTYVSVFAVMSTYDGIPHKDAMYPAIPPGLTVNKCLRFSSFCFMPAGLLPLLEEKRLDDPDRTLLASGVEGRSSFVAGSVDFASAVLLPVSFSSGRDISRMPSMT